MSESDRINAVLEARQIEQSKLRSELSRIEARLAELDIDVEALSLAQSVLGRLPLDQQANGHQESPRVTKPMLTPLGMTNLNIPQALERVLQMNGGQAHMTVLLDALQSAGKLKGKRRSNYSQAYRTMSDRPHLFKKIGEGVWALQDKNANAGG